MSARSRAEAQAISIHAPRTGSDPQISQMQTSRCYFNPRSPHGERRRGLRASCVPCRFQSTLPARGARAPLCDGVAVGGISIHAPRTGSDKHRRALFAYKRISIHAPRTGSDVNLFQHQRHFVISIHAPRTGSDVINKIRANSAIQFQSTLPARGATKQQRQLHCWLAFQSTLPARGATRGSGDWQDDHQDFNPRSPHGERLSNAP